MGKRNLGRGLGTTSVSLLRIRCTCSQSPILIHENQETNHFPGGRPCGLVPPAGRAAESSLAPVAVQKSKQQFTKATTQSKNVWRALAFAAMAKPIRRDVTNGMRIQFRAITRCIAADIRNTAREAPPKVRIEVLVTNCCVVS